MRKMRYSETAGRHHQANESTRFNYPATEVQLERIRDMGGNPRPDLSYSQANKAINALRSRAHRKGS